MSIRDELFKLRDLEYRDFVSKSVPNIDKDNIIGVRIPFIRKFALTLNEEEINIFLNDLPHKYLEENILHSVLISRVKSVNEFINLLDKFLLYVDNWCVSDTINCKVLIKDRNTSFKFFKRLLKTNHTYKIRFGILALFKCFLCDEYIDKANELVINIHSDEYYINMARSWYFQNVIVKYYVKGKCILESKVLDKFTHNKTISKCIDSYMVSNDKKLYLKGLRIK